MNRREFIRILWHGLLASATLVPKRLEAGQLRERNHPFQFVFAQIKYRGGDWNPYPLSVAPLMEALRRRTSVEPVLERRVVKLTDTDLFSYPFLYIAGKYDFASFTQQEIETLRRFLSYGGFLLADDALGQPGYGFDKSFRQEMKRLFPHKDLIRLPSGHAALRSYYLLRRIGGMKIVHPYLEGIRIRNATPVIYCQNGLGGAWERDPLGNWINPCIPGGEEQRRDAFHLGINLILYAMTENYKEDLIHVPFIRRRLSR
ncbi:MAG: DUF4159 domain-containing protein [Candidatus Binatia bacterium]